MELRVHLVSAALFVILGGVVALLLWGLHRQWWQHRAVRRAAWLVPAIGIGITTIWMLLSLAELLDVGRIFGFLVGFLLISLILLVIALPFSGIALSLERAVRYFMRKRSGDTGARAGAKDAMTVATSRSGTDDAVPAGDAAKKSSLILPDQSLVAPSGAGSVDLARRSFITTGATALPILAVGSSAIGVARAAGNHFTYPEMSFTYPNLHPDLEGLRILQISDLHLGYYVRLGSLEELLVGAEGYRPDLVVVTGDLSDDMAVYLEALRMIDQLKPRLGTHAALGNHEYHGHIETVLQAYDRGPVNLLVSDATEIKVGGARMRLAGADDPVAGGGGFENNPYLFDSVGRALAAPSDPDFTLLMTHRPEGFDAAAAAGVDLSLAGHTHAGGQIGWNGKSLVETWFGIGKYMWGLYEKNDGATKLYTTCGAGHWLPFRLGVPREVPVITLTQGGGHTA